jgi:meiosis-specific APC/C activator protein AMA1
MTSPPTAKALYVAPATSSIVLSTESRARRSFSTSHASDVRDTAASSSASNTLSLTGAPLPGFTLSRTRPSQPSHALRCLQQSVYPCGSSAQPTRWPQEPWTPPPSNTLPIQCLSSRRKRNNNLARLDLSALAAPLHSELDGCDERYVRATPPTKESFLLANTASNESTDPFSPALNRSTRTAGRLATRRSVSQPTVWSVGGSAVTEGVASTSNGRGGRVTSGSNAPHYAAEFLHRQSQTDETLTHGRRLAHAMDINQSGRVVEQTSPPSSPISPNSSTPSTPTSVSWQDCTWKRPPDASPTKVRSTQPKKIPTIPYRVLDAPALRDDYYCSLLAYSTTLQCLAVGLGPHVYLWSEDRASVQHKIPDSLTAPRGSSHVTSVSFSSVAGGSAILAIGRGDGRMTLWSPQDAEPRFDSEQPAPISYVCFRPTTQRRCSVRDANTFVDTEELLVGDEVGNVYLYSVEWADQDQRDLFDWHGSMTLLARISCHTQQICGVAWSPDGKFFATGGNDNNLFLFETKKILRPQAARSHTASSTADPPNNVPTTTNPPNLNEVLAILPGRQKHTFSLNAACKALAFASWQPTLLAAGGGSNDRCIHFFHALSGAKLATIDCYAQVTSLVFNPRKREIAATFGFAQPEHPYRVAVFAWPSCRMIVGIPWWGEERALYAIEYPGAGGSLVVATSDASIKFHEVWSGASADGGKGGRGVLGSPILDGELVCERESGIR